MSLTRYSDLVKENEKLRREKATLMETLLGIQARDGSASDKEDLKGLNTQVYPSHIACYDCHDSSQEAKKVRKDIQKGRL